MLPASFRAQQGQARAGGGREAGRRIDPEGLSALRSGAATLDRDVAAVQLARALWRRRADPRRTVVEVYLWKVCDHGGPIPATVGYLAAHDARTGRQWLVLAVTTPECRRSARLSRPSAVT